MAITKAKKGEIMTKLTEGLKSAETAVFVKFDRLTVKEADELRKDLRANGVSYFVAKKTLVKRALKDRGVTGDMPALEGELAVAWSKDAIAPAKGVFEFAKKHKEQMWLVGGIYQGAYQSKEEITRLASIPSREALYGQFVGMLNATYANVVRVLEQRRLALEATPAA